MPYTPPYPSGWEDFPNTSTPITAASLDVMDAGIGDAQDDATQALSDAAAAQDDATQALSDAAAAQATADGAATAELVINPQTGLLYVLVLADKGKLVEVNRSTGSVLEVPLNSAEAFPVGSQVTVLQTGAGQVTIAGTPGVTVNATPGLKLRTQWSSATLIKRATDTWVAIGDLVA
jgi:hypothetical protein